ncbi:MAG: 4-(cytidine 5'-diphospho)-2-C-methyl-D-erythritol kinase, partial [Clostridia bacterium]|nr:4-(cytidine 5'-diphospho)-2-C-methyl-D-erythritol kinase [Clostridia bacterium]
MVFENAYAKVNLTLDVGLKRDDGYHPVESVMQTVDLCDLLEFEENDTIEIKCNIPSLDCGESNLCHKAASAFGRHTGRSGMKLYLEKRIPFKAGLGGGSADAAAVLRALNRMYVCGLDAAALREIAKEVGSDVPFCVEGGTAKATGRGEIIEGLPKLENLYFAICMGGEGLSTAEIYDRFDHEPDLSHCTEALVRAVKNGDEIFGAMYNGL